MPLIETDQHQTKTEIDTGSILLHLTPIGLTAIARQNRPLETPRLGQHDIAAPSPDSTSNIKCCRCQKNRQLFLSLLS
ncbi:MAG: hypothetical protein U0798_02545 [Gemmataceae bacterium]